MRSNFFSVLCWQMDRTVFLLLSALLYVILATKETAQTDCQVVRCAGVEEGMCPGKYTPADPSVGKCCSSCLVFKELGESCVSNNFAMQFLCQSPYVCKNDVCSE
ncbi:hypothetical protein L798_08540 [Zootermopsis nevadensis]|uniref:Uncharacterized protein n=1 Tax=Zootermopsis nevadensis TaxID=136037 RepID=A0A067R572_ZOONE|nr:hypothetical protein L798_08540 [Zootermopsis nevadensis]